MAKDIDKEKAEHSEVSEQTEELKEEATTEEATATEDAEMKINGDDTSEEATEDNEIEKLKADVQEAKDKYLRLYSEFENFRRRTAKERLELISTATESLMYALLPVMDDFERAQKALEEIPPSGV